MGGEFFQCLVLVPSPILTHNSLFISMCILRDLAWQLEGTLSCDARGAPPILQVPMEIFHFCERGEKQGNKKRELFT